jgi:cell division protease FtsH
MTAKDDPMMPMGTRLARHWLRRLQRHAELVAIDQAVTAGIIDRLETSSGMVIFAIGGRVKGWVTGKVRLMLRQAFGIPASGLERSPYPGRYVDGTAIPDDDDDSDWLPLGSSKSDAGKAERPSRSKRSGGNGAASEDEATAAAAHAETVQLMLEDRAEAVPASGPEPSATPAGRKPSGVPGGGGGRIDRQPIERPVDRQSLLRMVRGHATPPSASSVATLLMLDEAVARSGHGLEVLLAILRRPKPVIAVIASAKGFETSFVDLFRLGFLLPGKASLMSGYELRSVRDVRVTDGSRRVLVHFTERDLPDDRTGIVERQVSLAIRNSYPILLTADDQENVPQALLDAADLHLTCGPVTPAVILETMKVVLGLDTILLTERRLILAMRRSNDKAKADASSGSVSRSTTHLVVDFDEETAARYLEGCAVLTIPDLALAIRPGLTPERCVDLLCTQIVRRQGQKDEPDAKLGKSNASSSSTGSIKGFTSRRERVGSGTTLIQPETEEVANGTSHGKPPLSVETLSGYGEARDWALALRNDLALWKAGSLGWAEMSTRLLLAGPPGTGKTTFARALGNTLRLPLLATSVGTWLEPSHLGDVLARMATAFEEARTHAPCLLFIDEIDGIGRRRHDNGQHDEYWNAVVNRALELMDGAVRTEGVILVGATNHPSAIDPALLRSGRLETRIDIPMPDVDALVGILQHHLGSDVQAVVSSTPWAAETIDAGLTVNPEASPARTGSQSKIMINRSVSGPSGLATAVARLIAWTRRLRDVIRRRWSSAGGSGGTPPLSHGDPRNAEKPGGDAR